MMPATRPATPERNLKPHVANKVGRMYRRPVTVNPVADLGRSLNLAHRRPIRLQALFLRPQFRVMAAVRGTPSGVPGAKFPVGQPAYSCLHNSLGREWWQPHLKLGATPVHTLNPSKIRAAAHRAMAIAALYADSSLATRLKRYNEAMAKARALEAQGGAQ